MSTEFTRVDDELERIQNLVLNSNARNAASLKVLEDSVTTRLEQTTAIVSTVATGQAELHTQLNTIHTNIARMNTASSLLSDTLQRKMETLTEDVANLAYIISAKFGGLTDTPMADPTINRITHSQNTINDLGFPPPLNARNSPTHTSTQVDNCGGVGG